ncbi:DUF2281 domain-containing protein [Alkalinema sp. FACHB-956]|nr:DUF2281 domain-containing protein [Alkalinema sp. FACHB-956]
MITLSESIFQHHRSQTLFEKLSPDLQTEILDYAEYLTAKFPYSPTRNLIPKI